MSHSFGRDSICKPYSESLSTMSTIAVTDNLLRIAEQLEVVDAAIASELTVSGRQAASSRKTLLFEERRVAIARVPRFWVTVLAAHPTIGNSISISDASVLAALIHVSASPLSGSAGFQLVLEFSTGSSVFQCDQGELVTVTKDFRCEDVAGLTVGSAVLPLRDEFAGGEFCKWLAGTTDVLLLGDAIRVALDHAIDFYFGTAGCHDELFEDVDGDAVYGDV
jgi:hypothetical protein